MGLITRELKGSKLTTSEMDGNLYIQPDPYEDIFNSLPNSVGDIF